jgi:hypothetical protein
MKEPVKNILFVLLLCCLLLPALQHQFRFADVGPLSGAVEKAEDTVLTVQAFMTDRYQIKTEKYLNSEFGFRNWMVRLNNQVAFSVYNQARANSVVVGKDNYLFEENYIKAYYGDNFIGEEKIRQNVARIAELRDTLKNRNIELIMIFAPGKGSYFPEKIPDRYKQARGQTNFQTYLREIKSSGIPFIDFHNMFLQRKAGSQYPLYPQTGIHWSVYGETMAIDSISKFIGRLRAQPSTEMIWGEITFSDSLRGTDKDLEDGCNLIFPIRKYPMAYPEITFREAANKPKVLTIADSYYWGIFGSGLAGKVFSKPQFWYYFREAHGTEKGSQKIEDLDIRAELEKHDVVMLLCTEATMKEFPYGFAEKMLAAYVSTEKEMYQALVQDAVAAIKGSPEWLDMVRKKAAQRSISLDSMIMLDARFIADQKYLELKKSK